MIEAGRELDALIAEFMGCRWDSEDGNRFTWLVPPDGNDMYWARKLDGKFDYFSDNLPRFSTEWGASGKLVENLQMTVLPVDEGWMAGIDNCRGYVNDEGIVDIKLEHPTTAATAAHAICLVFLKAKGIHA